MGHIHSGILLSHKKEGNIVICSNMVGPRDYHTKWSQTQKDKYHMISLICGIQFFKKDANELIYKTETDLQILKTNVWLPKGKRCGGRDKSGVWN